jgi:hypothetical protein
MTTAIGAHFRGYLLVPAVDLVAVAMLARPHAREAALIALRARAGSRGPVEWQTYDGMCLRHVPPSRRLTCGGREARRAIVPAGLARASTAARPRAASGIGPAGKRIGLRTATSPRRRRRCA